MSILNSCRICLSSAIRMHEIIGTTLQDIFEKYTNESLIPDIGKPVLACYLCCHQLRRFQKFLDTAAKTEQLLNDILNGSVHQILSSETVIGLSICPIYTMCIPEDSIQLTNENVKEEHTKSELGNDLEEDIDRNEDASDRDTSHAFERPTHELQYQTSDSEDDIPLKEISRTRTRVKATKCKKSKEMKGHRKKVVKDMAEYANEIHLTVEEQLAELRSRATSLNYLNSPLRCDHCYRGFVDRTAYENHMDKHNESRGPHACPVCRARYPAARQLRAHAAAAHARRYQCRRCDHRCNTANQAREHEKWHRGHTYECKLCGQEFRKSTSYLTHVRKRHPSRHACARCGRGFVGRHGLAMHRAKACGKSPEPGLEETPSSDQPFPCAACGVRLASRAAWTRHLLTAPGHQIVAEDGTCLLCSVPVPLALAAAHGRSHRRSLRPREPAPEPTVRLQCGECDRLFVNRSKLQAHINRMHLGLKYNKNIVCEVCGKKCTSNASLKYHQRTHTGERPHGCETCGKRFADSNQLRIHSRTHTGERPYCCGVCGKRFSQKPALNRHYRVHTGAKPYQCQFCTKTFSQSNSMKLHVKTVHLKIPPNNRRNKVQNAESAEIRVQNTQKVDETVTVSLQAL